MPPDSMNTMITLRDDSLKFSFPEIRDRLRSAVENHAKAVLPSVIAEDRKPAIEALQTRWTYRHADQAEQSRAENQLLRSSPSEIEKAFRKLSLAAAGLAKRGHSPATLNVQFQRTLRIPDDGKLYPLPAGLGRFPLRHIDDYAETVDPVWLERGGVLMPMYQSEALWIYFRTSYPFALKVAAGKINAVTGEEWNGNLRALPQNYLVLPEQLWLDGFAVRRGVIRQFVAMPLGAGYSVEEQITRNASFGGIQLQVFPIKAESYFRSHIEQRLPKHIDDLVDELVTIRGKDAGRLGAPLFAGTPLSVCESGMGLAAGGTMQQEILEDFHDFADWDQSVSSRCFVHLCNSMLWRQITGANPPHPSLTVQEYGAAGIPWFDYYRDDLSAVSGSPLLDSVKSVFCVGEAKGEKPLPDNVPIKPSLTIQFGNARRPTEVRQC